VKSSGNIIGEERGMQMCNRKERSRNSYGLAHMDLHFGNFFVDMGQQRIQLFDFDDCA
jgi:Ser/Thr protein kinase RdoA (MazF antagonist)